jgi:hypothetical protein
MDAAEQQHKLTLIRALTAGELAGWHRYCTAWRQPFPGEIVALMERAQTLGVSLPAARSVSATASETPQIATSPSMKF